MHVMNLCTLVYFEVPYKNTYISSFRTRQSVGLSGKESFTDKFSSGLNDHINFFLGGVWLCHILKNIKSQKFIEKN